MVGRGRIRPVGAAHAGGRATAVPRAASSVAGVDLVASSSRASETAPWRQYASCSTLLTGQSLPGGGVGAEFRFCLEPAARERTWFSSPALGLSAEPRADGLGQLTAAQNTSCTCEPSGRVV